MTDPRSELDKRVDERQRLAVDMALRALNDLGVRERPGQKEFVRSAIETLWEELQRERMARRKAEHLL